MTLGYGGASISLASIEILKVAYGSLGISVTGARLPAARSLKMAAKGQTDGEVNRIEAIEPDYPTLIRIPVVINKVEGVALSCGHAVDASSPESISKYRLGVKIGNIYAEKLTEGMPHVTKMPHEDKLLELLKAGRIDALIIDRTWANSILDDPDNSCLKINEPPLVTIPLYHYLHQSRAALVDDITRTLRLMEASGELEAIAAAALSR